jgi:hypothetical protein
MENIDTNIDNWSTEDLLDLFGLDNPSTSDILNITNSFISNAEKKNNDILSNFLKKARDKIIKSTESGEEEDNYTEEASDQLLEWRENQYLKQNDSIQSDKATSRFNKVDIFNDNDKATMKRETLGINQVYDVPVMQGTINPNLKNIVEKTIIIDSQYRPNILPYSGCDISEPSYTSNFSVELSESLTNVLSMQLNSISIPEAWNNISSSLGNNFYSFNNIIYEIEDGYYTVYSLITELNKHNNGLTFDYKKTKNKIIVTFSESGTITWYSKDMILNYGLNNNCNCVNTTFINNNLGWKLGFRSTNDDGDILETSVNSSKSATAEASINLYGPQYFLLGVDDYQNNRVNSAVVGIGKLNTKLDLPDYTTDDNLSCVNNSPVYIEKNPRKLTQAQLYTINTINENRKEEKKRQLAPTTNNILATIPIIKKSNITEDASGNIISMTSNINSILTYSGLDEFTKREYFGPVNIERLQISLYDDQGNYVDMNGIDWSFTLKIKQLYQY